MKLLDCGHAPTPHGVGTGVATAPNGRTMCYPCADREQREALATIDVFAGYVSGDVKRVTTWTGGKLADVTKVTTGKRRYTPSGGSYRLRYVWAKSPDGARWYGRGNDDWDVITLRRAKH